MINYIQHDKEFYGVIKLSQGEEIMGELIVTDDAESPGTSIVFITHPARSKAVEVEKQGQMGVGVGLLKWQYFSDEHFYIIPEKDILCISPMSPTGIAAYKRWLKVEEGIEDKSEEHPFYREVSENMGSLGSVTTAKSFLEKLFNAPSSDKS
tara:strand:- start:7211 stop:7666 length:456 start_codon:yes stop_codon:yes gene_type:complete